MVDRGAPQRRRDSFGQFPAAFQVTSQYANISIDRPLRNMRRSVVRIITRRKIREAYTAHPEWEASLASWYRIVKAASWSDFSDVIQSWRNVDLVDGCTVFDVGHNKCRLIAFIGYRVHLVFILHILSHAEYDKEGWKK
jgi:mRNA interferase HigB